MGNLLDLLKPEEIELIMEYDIDLYEYLANKKKDEDEDE